MNLKSFFGFSEEKIEAALDLDKDGIIGEYYENELPVIVKFNKRIPHETTQSKLPILTVISWSYDGSQRNGMPLNQVNQRIIELEKAITNGNSKNRLYKHAYSRIGNNLKELVYYSSSQEEFMQNLNKVLSKHERYPIDIEFYEDKEWSEFKKLLNDFNINGKIKS